MHAENPNRQTDIPVYGFQCFCFILLNGSQCRGDGVELHSVGWKWKHGSLYNTSSSWTRTRSQGDGG